jgi:hypothetical protein
VHFLQGVDLYFTAGPPAQAIHQNPGPISGRQAFFKHSFHIREGTRLHHHPVAWFERMSRIGGFLHPGYALPDQGHHVVGDNCRLATKTDYGSQTRGPADGRDIHGAVHANEKVTREEGDNLLLATLPNRDGRKIDLVPLAFQEPTNLMFLLRLYIESKPIHRSRLPVGFIVQRRVCIALRHKTAR